MSVSKDGACEFSGNRYRRPLGARLECLGTPTVVSSNKTFGLEEFPKRGCCSSTLLAAALGTYQFPPATFCLLPLVVFQRELSLFVENSGFEIAFPCIGTLAARGRWIKSDFLRKVIIAWHP